MPAIIPFIPLIAGGVAAGATVTSGVLQNRASNNATRAQTQATNEALAFERERYAGTMERNRPWVEGGQAASRRMSTLLNLPQGAAGPTAGPVASPTAPTGQRPQRMADILPFEARAQPRTVKLQAPDQSIMDVDESQAEHYISRGARRVG